MALTLRTNRSSISVVVYDSAIDLMWQPGGDIHLDSENWARTARVRASILAPRRSGTLRNSIYVRYSRGANKRRITHTIHATAKHARYVHEGTGPKKASSGGVMKLRPGGPTGQGRSMSRHAPQIFKAGRFKKLRGQKANPFLTDAIEGTLGRATMPMGGVRVLRFPDITQGGNGPRPRS